MTALRWIILIGVTGGLILFPALFEPLLRPFAPAGGPVIYDRASLAGLTASHLALVALAMIPSTLIALALAILVTRPAGAEFLPMARTLANVGQTFPPVAVLALSVPLLGFGARPTVLALFLYGLLPIFENALAGLRAVPGAVLLSGKAMGMTPRRILTQVEMPLALPLILEGIRISIVIALSTATIGSTIAARSLGEVIIAGLTSNNPAYVIQGGMLTGCIAVLLYDAFGLLIEIAKRRTGREPQQAI
ncbi:osmoprotectant transport system permease protein [Paracoccus aminovorans]|uniref:Osmoprotectant transport system permease protein n=1 Tax=Paracoccus aminovorans TaxID=34004 RepID=A0A1I3EAH3_9RHOB|nr:ABC transporter permease [Paracoccus aminovorans]CQR84550.1 ABC transporter permease [Paracoccus aminovorans]SFH95853.1 osmoprotectant transport system permease protein [Paracoccus aminovorans]